LKAFASALIACTLFAAHASALAQQYPNRPIKFIVPYGPGGGSDTTSRIIAKPLAEMLGQQIVIDNRPGAGTIIGAELAAKSPPDGYTIFSGITGTMAINPSIYAKLPYDPVKDFAPIAMVRGRAQRAGRASVGAGEEREGADRARESASRPVELCVVRRRRRAAPRGRALQIHGGCGHAACAL
jgi:hypothetical protein